MRGDGGDGRRVMRRVGIGAAVGFAATIGVVTALGMLAIVTRFARTVVVPALTTDEPARILGVDIRAGTITFAVDDKTAVPGRYSFWFDGGDGHARIGEILSDDGSSVTRRVLAVDFGDLAAATRGRLGSWYFLGPWEFGLPYDDVTVETDLGPAPAWVIPAAEPDGRWVVMVHGWSGRRSECLRAIPAFHAAGYTCLVISYRNDGEAPESADGRYGLGDTEWSDVANAMAFAAGRGAQRIVLAGWSMGGAIALQAALRPELAASISGLVLDSPAVDWHDVLAFQGALKRLPEPITRGVVETLGSGWGRGISGLATPIDFDRLNVLARADELVTPTLILHSVDDGFVPHAGSAELAELRPDLVTYSEWSGARHARLWNFDPDRWDRTVGAWLAALDAE
ncbi:MAG: alpha/beta fold hydrolase [Leifsonia sp.]